MRTIFIMKTFMRRPRCLNSKRHLNKKNSTRANLCSLCFSVYSRLISFLLPNESKLIKIHPLAISKLDSQIADILMENLRYSVHQTRFRFVIGLCSLKKQFCSNKNFNNNWNTNVVG